MTNNVSPNEAIQYPEQHEQLLLSSHLLAAICLDGPRSDGQDLAPVKEDWEKGFTVFPSQPLQSGQKLSLEFEMEGEFLPGGDIPECY